MERQKLTIVVSAYGEMTSSDNCYLAFIHADNGEELAAKFKTFMCWETVRAMTTPHIAAKLGLVEASKVYAALQDIEFPANKGERVVVTVSELSTDYHLECPDTVLMEDERVYLPSCRKAIVMTDYRHDSDPRPEFQSVMAFYDLASELNEDGSLRRQVHEDHRDGILIMTDTELQSHFLGWDRYVVTVM